MASIHQMFELFTLINTRAFKLNFSLVSILVVQNTQLDRNISLFYFLVTKKKEWVFIQDLYA